MARPIKETPVLLGMDAVRFQLNVAANEKRDHSASYSRAKAVYTTFEANEAKLRVRQNAHELVAR